VYQGDAGKAITFFEKAGFPCPEQVREAVIIIIIIIIIIVVIIIIIISIVITILLLPPILIILLVLSDFPLSSDEPRGPPVGRDHIAAGRGSQDRTEPRRQAQGQSAIEEFVCSTKSSSAGRSVTEGFCMQHHVI
jgi:flagellar basal body-associated protein FliL